MARQELRMLRRKRDVHIVNKVKHCLDEEDEIMQQVREDVEHGAMTEPRELCDAFWQAFGVERRIPAVTWEEGLNRYEEREARYVLKAIVCPVSQVCTKKQQQGVWRRSLSSGQKSTA